MQECFDSWDRQPGTSRRYAPSFTDDPDLSRRAFDASGRRLTNSGVSLSSSELTSRIETTEHKVAGTRTYRVTLNPGELNSLNNFRNTMMRRFPGASSFYVLFSRGTEVISSSVFGKSASLARGSFASNAIKNTISRYGVTSPILPLPCDDVTMTLVLREVI